MAQEMRLPTAIALVLLLSASTTLAKEPPDGYKILGYSQPPPETQPTFTIANDGTRITARCQNYYGNHVGCDQLKTKVGAVIPISQMRTIGNPERLQYNPNGFDRTCSEACEFLEVTARKSINR